jgi:hypothetical protein
MYTELITIAFVDILQRSYYYYMNLNYSNITKWFFLHSIVNSIIVYYSLPDVYMCLSHTPECYKIEWNNNSIKVYNYAIVLHIYHCLFFKLTKEDYLHHFLMVTICGTLCYIIQSIISSFALFFLSGLPGAIDYMLLYLVKINKINSITEKKIYTYLSGFLRSPGCMYTFIIGCHGLTNYYNEGNYRNLLFLFVTISLIFWNGQYYFMQIHESYLRKV